MERAYLAGGGRNIAPIWHQAANLTSKSPEAVNTVVIVAASEGYPRLTGALTTERLTDYGLKQENILVVDAVPESVSQEPTAEQQGIGLTPKEKATLATYSTQHVRLTYPGNADPASLPNATKVLEKLKKADLVIITGGNQYRLKQLFNALPGMQTALTTDSTGNKVLAGTSAGAMIQASLMITNYQFRNGQEDKTLPAQTAPGLGLLPSQIVVDTHFSEKNRFGRLASLVASTGKVGLGIDEDTGIYRDGNKLTVTGPGNAYVITPADQATSCPEREIVISSLPFCSHLQKQAITVFRLTAGDCYDLTTGKATPSSGINPPNGLSL